jgi:hypothetical protein
MLNGVKHPVVDYTSVVWLETRFFAAAQNSNLNITL